MGGPGGNPGLQDWVQSAKSPIRRFETVRAVLSAGVLLLTPLALMAQDHKPNVFYFGHARGDGPVIGVETRSGSVRDTLGVLVIGVTTNGPADKAGIEEGDRIASANGVDLRLTPADAADHEMHGLMSRRLARAVQKLKAGDAVDLRVYHDGQYKSVKVTTVKASDLTMDDDAMFGGDIEYLPEIKAGRMLDGMRLEMPDFERIRLQMPDMQPGMDALQRSIRKLKTMPVEIYETGVHRI